MTKIKEQFHPGIKYALSSNFRNWKEAILELLDNAVSDRIMGVPLQVSVLIGPELIEIENLGGVAMNPEKMGQMFSWGEQKDRQAWDIGAYGQGGKAAMTYLGNEMEIISSPRLDDVEYSIKDANLHDISQLKEYDVQERNAKNYDQGYVRISLRQLRRRVKGEEVEDIVCEYYRPLIERKEIQVTVNGKDIKLKNFPLDPEFNPQSFEIKTVRDDGRKIEVRGWIGRLQSRSGLRGGFRVYKLGRLITSQEYFGKPDANYKQSLNLLFGEVHLDYVTVTTNKTSFDQGSIGWQSALTAISPILDPYINDLLGRDIKEPTDEEKDKVEQTRQILAEIMKQRDMQLKGISGAPDSTGQKPPVRNEDPTPRVHNNHTDRKNEPRTPPPAGAIGKRRRLNEFIDMEPRAIDENVRSVVEVINDGKKKLVINNQFPGYKANKDNDKANGFYLLETAALQLCKIDGDNKLTASEFIIQFDELLAYCCENFELAKDAIKKRNATRKK